MPVAMVCVVVFVVWCISTTYGFLTASGPDEARLWFGMLLCGGFIGFRLLDAWLRTPLLLKGLSAWACLMGVTLIFIHHMPPDILWHHGPIDLLQTLGLGLIMGYFALEGVALAMEWVWRLMPDAQKRNWIARWAPPVLDASDEPVLSRWIAVMLVIKALVLGYALSGRVPQLWSWVDGVSLLLMSSMLVLAANGGLSSWRRRGLFLTGVLVMAAGASSWLVLSFLMGLGVMVAANRLLFSPLRVCVLFCVLLLVAVEAHILLRQGVGFFSPLWFTAGAVILGGASGFLGMLQSYCGLGNRGWMLFAHWGLWAPALLNLAICPWLGLACVGLGLAWWCGITWHRLRAADVARTAWRVPIKERVYHGA